MRAADAGLCISELTLGLQYLNGEFLPANPELGLRWVKKATRQGLPGADFVLAIAYETGLGAKQNLGKAAELYGKAAEGGHAGAQNNLARLDLQGQGVHEDADKAMALSLAA